MRAFVGWCLAWVIVALMASCGGGSVSAPAGSGDGTNPGAAPIRYQGSWRPSYFDSTLPDNGPNATLTLRPIDGDTAFTPLGVQKVEVRLDQAAPVVLTAPNSTDAAGRPQYVFDFGRLTELQPICVGNVFPLLQIAITVTDNTGFAFTKRVAGCATNGAIDFGAFSDYGSTTAQFTAASNVPVTLLATRTNAGGYTDKVVARSQPALDTTLPAAQGDRLMLQGIQLPMAARLTTRIEGGGGAFAQGTYLASGGGGGLTALECCGPRPAAADMVAVRLALRSSGAAAGDRYTYAFKITDPDTGAVIGSQSDTIYGAAMFTLQVRRGQVIEMSVTPRDAGVWVEASADLGSGDFPVVASSNEVGTPAQFRVICCSR